jgi:hypothetical protein
MYSYFREEEKEDDACLGIISIDSLEEAGARQPAT